MESPEVTPTTSTEQRWENFIRFFVENKLVVFIMTALLVLAGLAFAPFRWDLGALPRDPMPVDALPDISENQQIVFTKWPGRSPRDVEDQVTYPLTTALLGIPGVKSVRSSSVLGFSSIYVIFEDEIEFYWSRSRVLEKIASLPAGTLPDRVAPALGPDATALGQVFWYTLEAQDDDGNVVPGAFGLDELRTIQDWSVRYSLQAVAGVSEVASIGGFVREYQVDVDPESMLAYGVSLGQIAGAVRGANLDVGARTIEINRAEYIIRGLGFIEEPEDLEKVVITSREHTPIRIADVASVNFGPALRRGALDVAGAEAVGGVVTVRYGDNPLSVIERIKTQIEEIGPGLPSKTMADGTVAKVQIVPFYDRSVLILETLDTLALALVQQVLITVVVVLLIMRHLRSSILVSVLLPLGVFGTFVLMRYVGIDANVMALGGIAIAIGTMVDMGIVFTENIVHHIEDAPPGMSRTDAVCRGAGEVAAAVMTSIMTTILGFVPIFGLAGSEGKLFSPLAYTKTFALVAAFILAVIVLPPLADMILRSRHSAREEAKTRLWQRMFRRETAFDAVMLVAGMGLLISGLSLAGAIVIGVASLRLVEPVLPQRLRFAAPLAANGLTVVAVTLALTEYWMPLGPGESYAMNLGFVVATVAILMSGFAVFQYSYRSILRWCLEHKSIFLGANVAFILLGATAWLGGPTTLGWLRDPEVLEEDAGPGEGAEEQAPAEKSEPSLLARWTGPTLDALDKAMPGLKSDFMPPFDEGAYLFMPTTTPHASIGQSLDLLQAVDAAIAEIPEVTDVVGKLGRAESPLDPAPIMMMETVINYLPEFRRVEHGRIGRFRYDEDKEEFVRDSEGELIEDNEGRPYRNWREHIHSVDGIWDEITKAAKFPGLTGSPKLMPIKTRIVMLQTGMRSAVGMKIRGPDLDTIEAFGLKVEALLKVLPEADESTVLADRIVGKPYLELDINRDEISRYGLTINDVQDVIQIAIGGKMLTRTVEGRERYPVRVRYMREERDDVDALRRVLVAGKGGEQVPLEQLAEIRYVRGPQMIRSEDTFLNGYVTWDPAKGIGEVESVMAARAMLDKKIASGELVVPAGVSYRFAGTYENQQRSQARLSVLVPIALMVIFMLLYLQFRRTSTALMVFSGMLLAASGGFIMIWLYGQPYFLNVAPFGIELRSLFQVGTIRMTVAVWVGFLALFGIATDNGVIVATYLTQSFRGVGELSVAEIRARVVEAGHRRVRPCLMTTATTLLALLPVITSKGRGADLMIPMALPTVGGVALTLVTLLTVPVLFSAAREFEAWKTGLGRAKD